jgi:hypothetical protein
MFSNIKCAYGLLRSLATSSKSAKSQPDFTWGNVPELFNLPDHSSRTMALESTQPLTEMSTRNLPGGKKQPARRADNFAAISEPNV